MNRKSLLLSLVISLLFVACGEERTEDETASAPIPTTAPAAPTLLPTAVPPVSESGGSWTVTYQYDFPDSFWILGDHSYGFKIHCPAVTEEYSGEWKFFEVTQNEVARPFPIYLRLEGLSTEQFSPLYMENNQIHPDQATSAVVHLVGLSAAQAELAREECELLIAWDLDPPQELKVADVFEQ